MIKVTDLHTQKSFSDFLSPNNTKPLNTKNTLNNNGKDVFVNNKKDNVISSKKIAGITFIAGLASVIMYKAIKSHNLKSFQKLLNIAKQQDIPYIQTLAQDIGKILNKDIKTEQLSSVMGKNELMAILPTLKRKNYFAYKEMMENNISVKKFVSKNLEKGIFQVDLHSHTNYSDGLANVEELLDNVAKYADKLNQKTGKKFIFSITDHDTISGVQEALKLIANNPEKYKNIRFVPGVELSFIHYTDKGEFVVSEMLAHSINPFSEKTVNFINSLINNRQRMCNNIIKDLNNNSNIKYSLNEVQGDFFDTTKDFYKYNLVWRMFNYAQIKQRLSKLAAKWGKNPESVYSEIMPQWHVFQIAKSPSSFEKFMKDRGVDLSDTVQIDDKISKIFEKYLPHIENNEIKISSERTFEEIIKHFSKDNDSIIGFAHPAFLTMYYKNPKLAITNFMQKSNNIIKTTEKYHQAYFIPLQNKVLNKNIIDETDKIFSQYDLLKIGGHDNHAKTLL